MRERARDPESAGTSALEDAREHDELLSMLEAVRAESARYRAFFDADWRNAQLPTFARERRPSPQFCAEWRKPQTLVRHETIGACWRQSLSSIPLPRRLSSAPNFDQPSFEELAINRKRSVKLDSWGEGPGVRGEPSPTAVGGSFLLQAKTNRD